MRLLGVIGCSVMTVALAMPTFAADPPSPAAPAAPPAGGPPAGGPPGAGPGLGRGPGAGPGRGFGPGGAMARVSGQLPNGGPRNAQWPDRHVAQLQRSAERMTERAQAIKARAQAPGVPPEDAARLMAQAAEVESRAKEVGEEAKQKAALLATPEGRAQLARDARSSAARNRRDRLKRRWGKTLENAEAQSELKMHAVRAARLQRIRDLAAAAGDNAGEERCRKLLRKEQARHDGILRSLQTKVGGPGAPAAAPAADEPDEAEQ